MFVAKGCDWTTEILNDNDTWCDSIYAVVRGAGSKAYVLAVHGSWEELRTWLARATVERRLPPGKATWAVLHTNAKTLKTQVLCKAVGSRIFASTTQSFPKGSLRDALQFEIDMLG